MGKNRKGNAKNADLGKNLIRKQRGQNSRKRETKESWLHTSEVQDGSDWNRLNLQSVTEQNTLEEFLETAALAGVEFTAERLNVKIVGTGLITGVLGESEKARVENLQNENRKFVTIPRRPEWDESTTSEELTLKERDAFLNWRRSMAMLQEKEGLLLTPYEKNLDVWRQLWRVIERSDVICQIVDARNPLLFKCDDLATYVKEVDKEKGFVVIINKADYLTEEQKTIWAEYFAKENIEVIFWSALDESEDKIPEEELEIENKLREELIIDDHEEEEEIDIESDDNKEFEEPKVVDISDETSTTLDENANKPKVLSRSELLQHFKQFNKIQENKFITIGLVGYPNVGKSSTINALMKEKKTSVSATPGKTKHFQTLFIDDELCLCDCPGLVFPTFISTKADMVLNGILPIDQLRDHVAPTTVLCQMIPRKIIENTYGINIQKPRENEDQNRPPTSEEMLSAYAKMRGYMTSSGQPDCPRACRYILKDFIKGKLLYCHPPPEMSPEDFQSARITSKVMERIIIRESKLASSLQNQVGRETSEMDEEFFEEKKPGFHFKMPTGMSGPVLVNADGERVEKPWKKHFNRGKKEKLRRIHDKKST